MANTSPAPALVLSQEAGGHPHHDLFHSLADEFHQEVGVLLDKVLQGHALELKQRREIVCAFMFRLMSRLDEEAPVRLSAQCFANYPELSTAEPHARQTWQPTLAFLRRDCDAQGQPGQVQHALACTETWLHEVCGDPLDHWFDAQEHA